MTASATSERTALKPAIDSNSTTTPLAMMRFIYILFGSPSSSELLQVVQAARAVADTFPVNVKFIQHAQQQIAGRHRLGRISQMTAAFEFPVQSTDEYMRHVVMEVLIGVPHVRSIENQRMIQQRSITISGL